MRESGLPLRDEFRVDPRDWLVLRALIRGTVNVRPLSMTNLVRAEVYRESSSPPVCA
jgi:hypothetical protein